MSRVPNIKGALGQKQLKPPKKPRKPIPPISAKKRRQKAAEKAHGAWDHMQAVKGLPCACCGAYAPSYAHHVTGDSKPRSDFRVIPLCYACHQGPDGYHMAKASWVDRYGPDYEFLPWVDKMLGIYPGQR